MRGQTIAQTPEESGIDGPQIEGCLEPWISRRRSSKPGQDRPFVRGARRLADDVDIEVTQQPRPLGTPVQDRALTPRQASPEHHGDQRGSESLAECAHEFVEKLPNAPIGLPRNGYAWSVRERRAHARHDRPYRRL
jgi:hypothetical protein